MAAKKGALAPKYLTPLPKKPGAQSKPSALVLSGPGGQPVPKPRTSTLPVGNAPPGRPPSNLGNYLLRPTPDTNTGFEMLNDNPELLKEVHRKFLKLRQLPYGLRPTGLAAAQAPKYTDTPDVLEHNRANAISNGWKRPLGRKG